MAKAIVRLGLAQEVTVTLGWFPGDREARVVSVVAESGRRLDVEVLAQHFDLSLKLCGEGFAQGGLLDAARWGHFSNLVHPWEERQKI
jgi:S-adenosylmethionine synthetase